jgi:hypothetical protein
VSTARSLPHRTAPRPLHFPSSAEMPETKRHLDLRTFLYAVLCAELRAVHSVGSEQFVYFNARDPKRCLAPDAFVKLGVPDESFDSWKTWERGTPELCVEIASTSDAGQPAWSEKLERYHEMGAREVVRFDADAGAGQRLRIWDRIDDDLVERAIEADRSACTTLGLYFVVAAVDEEPLALRLSRDAAGKDLLPSPAEARAAAERRVAELETELRRRGR